MWLIKVNRGKRLRWISRYARHVIDSMIVLLCSTSSMHTTSTQCTTAATTLFRNQLSQKIWKIWEASNILERPHLLTRERERERERDLVLLRTALAEALQTNVAKAMKLPMRSWPYGSHIPMAVWTGSHTLMTIWVGFYTPMAVWAESHTLMAI